MAIGCEGGKRRDLHLLQENFGNLKKKINIRSNASMAAKQWPPPSAAVRLFTQIETKRERTIKSEASITKFELNRVQVPPGGLESIQVPPVGPGGIYINGLQTTMKFF